MVGAGVGWLADGAGTAGAEAAPEGMGAWAKTSGRETRMPSMERIRGVGDGSEVGLEAEGPGLARAGGVSSSILAL